MESESKRAILAVVLSGIILFGWQYFYGAQPTYETQPTTTTEVATNTNGVDVAGNNAVSDNQVNVAEVVEEQEITLTNSTTSIVINNKLQVIDYKSINSKESLKAYFADAKNDFELVLGDSLKERVTPFFSFTKKEENRYQIFDSKNGIEGYVFLDDKGFLNVDLNSAKTFAVKFGFSNKSIEKDAQFNNYMYLSEGLEVFPVGDEDKGSANISWFGIDESYHFLGYVLGQSTNLSFELKGQTKGEDEFGTFKIATAEKSNKFSYKVVFVKKNYDELIALGDKLELSVDFGMWSIIAVPILRGLQWFYSVSHNYGLAIVFLTIILRMALFPLQYKSFKSMKKMQIIQPELTKIREKYKDDPQKMQQETMAMFKKAGANPLGGCLPLLLQMPVFFAFYKVLYSAVELVDAPFYFWILDLSQKDPYYVLPVLMGLAMALNMKLTPTTTADPMQQKMMMFMPILFTGFMLNLPSGLTLYILVSTVVGMLQQIFVFKRTT